MAKENVTSVCGSRIDLANRSDKEDDELRYDLRRILPLPVANKYNGSQKRGPGRPSTTPDIAALVVRMAQENPTWDYTLSLHEALTRLAVMDPRQASVVELRYVGGLTIDEVAASATISRATVKRELRTAIVMAPTRDGWARRAVPRAAQLHEVKRRGDE